MNTKNTTFACASSDRERQWHQIDWSQAHRNVRRLQARIVKATKAGRWGKVQALQWLLTHSLSGKTIAVKQVTENQGKKTPGVDGETWSTPEAKTAAVKSLQRRGYQPKPLRRVYIPKSNGKKRPLGIPTMRDRAMQALYLLALDPVSETLADRNSYGFRKGRSTHDAIEQCFTVLNKGKSPKWVLEGDIQGCFDNISHEWMEANIPMDKAILRKWLKAGVIEKGKLFSTEQGTPQGGIISPTLANMVLDGLAERLASAIRQKKSNGKVINPMINLVRYADDFIITGSTPEVLERAKEVVREFLQERGLSLSEEKTRIVHIETGFDFLGQNVRMYSGKLLIKPSKNAIKRVLTKIRTIIQENKTVNQEILISLLNPVIRGWVNYHRYSVASKAFSRFDHEVWQALWKWAIRRHTKKGARWVRTRYFHTVGNRTWTFASKTGTVDRSQLVKLVHATDTNIKRHRKIKAEANPYDPDWETYFEERLTLRMGIELLSSRNAWRLWQCQKGHCLECGELITPETGWHVHHVVYRVYGGKDILSNLRLLHPNCHRKLHHEIPSQSLPGSLTRAFERLEPCMEKFICTVLRGLGCRNALRLPDGNITTIDKPTPQELGWLASYVTENVKEGDRILVRGRLQGTPDGKPSLWVDKTKLVHACYLSLTVHELSITEAKANRPTKPYSPMPVVEETAETPVESQPQTSRVVSMPVKSSPTADDVFAKYLSKS